MLKMGLLSYLLFSAFFYLSHSREVSYDFDIGWVIANPDNAFPRAVVGINGKWPLPQITVDVGDRVIVNVVNSLGNSSTGLHFHGIYQNGTTHMDGSVGVTQCQIAPGQKMTYNFTVRSEIRAYEQRLTALDRTTRHLLVSRSSAGPVSRWSSSALDRS